MAPRLQRDRGVRPCRLGGRAAGEGGGTYTQVLAQRGLRSAVVHSGLTREDRREVLAGFGGGDPDVIAAPRVLDEGVDVPAADLAVIAGASRSRRQMIQRMGRVLRRSPTADGLASPWCSWKGPWRIPARALTRPSWTRSCRWPTMSGASTRVRPWTRRTVRPGRGLLCDRPGPQECPHALDEAAKGLGSVDAGLVERLGRAGAWPVRPGCKRAYRSPSGAPEVLSHTLDVAAKLKGDGAEVRGITAIRAEGSRSSTFVLLAPCTQAAGGLTHRWCGKARPGLAAPGGRSTARGSLQHGRPTGRTSTGGARPDGFGAVHGPVSKEPSCKTSWWSRP